MNQELIEKEVAPIIEQALGVSIKTAEDMPPAVELLSQLNKIADRITEEKEKITTPLNAALKAERARWKSVEAEYTQAISKIRQEMTRYQTEQVKKTQEAEQKLADRVAFGNLKVETAVRKMDELVKPDKEIETTAGSVKFKVVKKFEVVDMTLLPLNYHIPDEVAIRKQMVAGNELPGVKYWEEQQVNNYR